MRAGVIDLHVVARCIAETKMFPCVFRAMQPRDEESSGGLGHLLGLGVTKDLRHVEQSMGAEARGNAVRAEGGHPTAARYVIPIIAPAVLGFVRAAQSFQLGFEIGSSIPGVIAASRQVAVRRKEKSKGLGILALRHAQPATPSEPHKALTELDEDNPQRPPPCPAALKQWRVQKVKRLMTRVVASFDPGFQGEKRALDGQGRFVGCMSRDCRWMG